MEKKILKAALCLLLLFALTACSMQKGGSSLPSSPVSPQPDETAAAPVRIGLLQYGEDPAQNIVREAFMSRLEEWNYDEEQLSIDYQNAGGDAEKAESVCQKFVQDEVDMIVAISTPAAQAAVQAAGGTDIAVAASAGAQWKAEGNAVSVTVKPDVRGTLDLALAADGKLSTLGLLYDPEDPDSKAAVEEAKAWCAEKSIAVEEASVTDPQKAVEAMTELYKKAGAVYTPGGRLASATGLLAAEAIRLGKPWYAGSDAMVQNGALAAVSADSTELGNRLADLAVEKLGGREEIPVESLTAGQLYVNQATLGNLALILPEELLKTADFYTETTKETDTASAA